MFTYYVIEFTCCLLLSNDIRDRTSSSSFGWIDGQFVGSVVGRRSVSLFSFVKDYFFIVLFFGVDCLYMKDLVALNISSFK